MRDNTYMLAYDPTGENPENLVLDEEHHLNADYQKHKRALIMNKGFFYTDSVTVRDEGTRTLTYGVDYKILFLHSELTAELGRSVAGVIVILNENVANRVYVDAQMVGGEYTKLRPLIERLLNTLNNKERAVNYINLSGTPDTYKPVRHYQSIADTMGWEAIRKRMVDINYYLIRKGDVALNRDFGYIQQYISNCQAGIDATNLLLKEHEANTNDPHDITLAQLKLDTYSDRVILTREGLYTGNRYRDYFTPSAAARYVEETATALMNRHTSNTDIPHATTLEDINALDEATVKDLPSHYYDENEKVADATALEGHTLESYVDNLKQEGSFDNLTGRPIDLSLLGKGETKEDSVLLGNGTWKPFSEVMKKYAPKRPRLYTLGYIGNEKDNDGRKKAIAWAEKNIPDAEIGSMCLYSSLYSMKNEIDTISQTNSGPIPCAIIKGNDGLWRRCGYINEKDYHWSESGLKGGGISTASQESGSSKDLTMMAGTYSVFLVGGGGAGNGGNGMCGAGGASGYAWKGRITLKEGDKVRFEVGAGGGSGTTGNEGQRGNPTIVYVNGNEVARANPGNGATNAGGAQQKGGAGASGGGSANGNQYHGKHNHYLGNPGGGGWNGGNGGNDSGTGHNWAIPGGNGAGTNYYGNIMRSVDPSVTHGFDLNNISKGGSGWMKDGTDNPGLHATFAGGGGGVGMSMFGESQNWRGAVFNCTGFGHGAGGGGRQRGIAGFASIVRVGD